jgi:hypothetical protein
MANGVWWRLLTTIVMAGLGPAIHGLEVKDAIAD